MKYKHEFSIKHMPKFIFGAVLIPITLTAVVLNTIAMIDPSIQAFPTTLLFIVINTWGIFVGVMLVVQGSVYKATENPNDDLTSTEQLKKDLKG